MSYDYLVGILDIDELAVPAKSTSDAAPISPNPKSPKLTIHTVAHQSTDDERSALALPVDVRNVENVKDLVNEMVKYVT